MRATALLPLVCAFVAFILSMLVLFGGDSPKTLTSVYLLRLNASGIGKVDLFKRDLLAERAPFDVGGAVGDAGGAVGDAGGAVGNVAGGAGNVAGDAGNVAGDVGGQALDAGKDVANKAANAVTGAITDALDIPEFFSAYLQTYCEGDFKPNAADPDADMDIKDCSARKPFFAFDPAAIIQSKLPSGLGLGDIKFPKEVTDGIKALGMASKAMYFFYVVGIACAGIGMVGSVFGILAFEHLVALANLFVISAGFFSLGLASSIASVIAFKATDAINENGGKIGLEADRGNTFLIMTWIATVLMLLGTIGWIGEFFMGRKSRYFSKEEAYY